MKMESVLEILIWIIIAMIVFYIANTVCCIRTAGSLFWSFLVATVIIGFVYRSIFAEIMLMVTIAIALFLCIFRSARDRRDDAAAKDGRFVA
jgi:uncharacterized membrane protein